MDQILVNVKKRYVVAVVVLVALSAWLILCHAHYRSYWFGTIYRVQTTDFNILHHTLPQTLSRMIIEGRSDLVQKTLDSTYGLFGLVVTDPSGETVLWKTSKVYHRRSWQKNATPELLQQEEEPFDLLTAPVELSPEYIHRSPRSARARKVHTPEGMVLGRVYYLRPDPPSFLADMTNFASTGLLELSGAKRGYLYVTLSCTAFALIVLLVFMLRKRGFELKQKELEHIQRELEIRKKALEHLSTELAAQKSRKIWLEKEADQAYRRALGLKKSLEKLRDSIMGVQQPAGGPDSEQLKVRPPVHPPSAILEEIEALLPGLSENASVLRHQAGVLHEYCSTLEQRQQEMQRIVNNAYQRAGAEGVRAAGGDRNRDLIDMSPQ